LVNCDDIPRELLNPIVDQEWWIATENVVMKKEKLYLNWQIWEWVMRPR